MIMPDERRTALCNTYLADETAHLQLLLPQATLDASATQRVHDMAYHLVSTVRKENSTHVGLDAFLREYDLSSQEGVLLMCLAEALLRIPDAETADKLIRDKLSQGEWDTHWGHSHSLLVNASTWGLMLTGSIIKLNTTSDDELGSLWQRRVAKSGAPVIRLAIKQAMHIMAQQFVMASDIKQAHERSQLSTHQTYRYSYDMLGEAALSAQDAERYFAAYMAAIQSLGQTAQEADLFRRPSISVKLSALHPRYEYAQRERVLKELAPRILTLTQHASRVNIGITLDAEEADRLELSLDIFVAVFNDPSLKDYHGFGLAVQAYQKRALCVLDWLASLARQQRRRIPVRLVKGAYWDTEIKRAQVQGLAGYPVFTRKAATDVSYLVCARRLLVACDAFYPQFATHNAHTVAYILEQVGNARDFEFQRLHGMGEALYGELMGSDKFNVACRVYAPVGNETDLLPYLVRRLLENGANTSFVHRLADEKAPIEKIIADPVQEINSVKNMLNGRVPLPMHLYGDARCNSRGINFADLLEINKLHEALHEPLTRYWQAAPIVGGQVMPGVPIPVFDPSDKRREVGSVILADAAMVDEALWRAAHVAHHWDNTPATTRADILCRAADIFEQRRAEFIALCVREGGKTIPDAAAEVREAVDFCRYYALLAQRDFAASTTLPGPTGESNQLSLHGRGVFVCISPWNFPLAIFIGQITAALAAGNAVVAKPASQTPLIAAHAVRVLHEAGVPSDVLHFLPGKADVVGRILINDLRVAGVAFTGSTETARFINQTLATRSGAIVAFVAETGGQNAMIADSSALVEQLVIDVMHSAFNSAGQRCSALRVLFVQDDIAPRVLHALKGAMDELQVGNPALLTTDIGPVIDAAAQSTLYDHVQYMRTSTQATLIHQLTLPENTQHGSFFAPCVFEINDLRQLDHEVFGPCLHVIRYTVNKLDDVIDAINNTGYGLTLGIHSRIEETVRYIQQRVRVGNIYVNRNMIGAVVGVQPFGGEGLSGTGPKAGGPHTLLRFATERVISVNTAAVGGNAALLASE